MTAPRNITHVSSLRRASGPPLWGTLQSTPRTCLPCSCLHTTVTLRPTFIPSIHSQVPILTSYSPSAGRRNTYVHPRSFAYTQVTRSHHVISLLPTPVAPGLPHPLPPDQLYSHGLSDADGVTGNCLLHGGGRAASGPSSSPHGVRAVIGL